MNNGLALAAAAYVIDALETGYTVVQPTGVTAISVPTGSPYKELGAVGAGATLTFTAEFTRVGTPALIYTPRILGGGAR